MCHEEESDALASDTNPNTNTDAMLQAPKLYPCLTA